MSENKSNAFGAETPPSAVSGAELFTANDPFANMDDDQKFIGDLDAFLKSMGVTPISSSSGDYELQTQSEPLSFDAPSFEPITDTVAAETKKATPVNEQYAKNVDEESYVKAQKKKKKFRKNFRVLSGDADSAQTIHEESQPSSKASNVADSVATDSDEDIFASVEKAQRKKRSKGVFNANGKSADSMKKRAKTKKREQVLVSAKALRENLSKNLKRQKIQLIILAVLGVISLVLYILPSFYAVSNPLEFLFGNGGRVYGIINIVCLLTGIAAGYDRFIAAIKSLKDFNTDSNTGLIILSVFVLLHDILTIVLSTSGLSGVDLYTVYAVFAVALAVISENLKCKMAYRNLVVICKGTTLDSINPVDNDADAEVFLKGIAKKGQGSLLYCAQAETIRSLNPNIGKRSGESKFYSICYLAVILASIVCGAIMVMRSSLPSMFLTGILSCVCLCGPTVCEIARTALLYRKNRELNADSAAIISFEGVEQMGKAKAIVVDSSAVFSAKVEHFKKVKSSLVSQTHSAVYTASLLKDTGCLIYGGFEDFVKNLSGELPVAEDVEYITGAGYKGKVNSKSILVGNRRLMTKYSIPVPTEAEEKRYAKGNLVYYVAVDSSLCATFVVTYNVIGPAKKASALFNKTGLILLLSSKDPDLREKRISSKLNIDISAIKILGEQGYELMQEYKQNKTMRQANSLVCSRKRNYSFNLAVEAHRLFDADRLVLGMNIAGQVIFFALIIAAVFMNVPAVFSPMSIIFMRLAWSALTLLIGTIKK